MKTTRFFTLTLLMLSALFLSNAFAQDFPPTTILDLEDIRAINRIVISPDGTIFAIHAREPRGPFFIRLFDLATGERLHTLPSSTSAIAFSPDGQTIADINAEDKTVRLWDVATGTRVHTLHGHETPHINYLVFTPDGNTLISGDGGEGKTIHLWDTAAGTLKHTLQANQYFSGLALSPDGKTLAITQGLSGTDGYIQLWDLDTRQVSTTLDPDGSLHQLAFSPDGKTLAVASTAVNIPGWAEGA